jgi:hypothetical protein
MNKKTISTVLSLALLACFFLPFISIDGYNVSGFQIVFGKDGESGIGSSRYLFVSLLIPIGAILILLDSLSSGSSSYGGYGYWMPLVGILYLAVMIYLGMQQGAGTMGGSLSMGEIISALGYAFWITLAASVILIFNKP